MRREVLKFDGFLVWKFFMDRGDVKRLNEREVTRGLTTHGPWTVNPIAVAVRGSFLATRDGREPLRVTAGQGAPKRLDADSFLGLSLTALEDGSEYHCITPRDHEPRFWERYVHDLKAGDGFWIGSDPKEFVYVASGRVRGTDHRMISTEGHAHVEAEEDSILVRMFTYEGTDD